MRRTLFLVTAVVLAGGGLFAAVSAVHDALVARQNLVSELSASLGRVRVLDTVAQQIRAEQGTATSAASLLRGSLTAVRSRQERASLEAALACVTDGGCPDAAAPLAGAQESYVESVTHLWSAVDDAEARVRSFIVLGVVLVLLGLAAAAAAPKPTPPTPAPSLDPAPDDRALEEVLKQRLEALYKARSQLGDNARFGAFGELAAALSHGLKTPLAGVLASIQLAQLKLGDANPAHKELDEVVRLTESLTEQVQRFLRAAGQVGPQRQAVRAGEVLGQLDQAYAKEAKQRGIQFVTSTDEAQRELEVDPSLLDMALRNLVENALAAVQGGQAVTVSARVCAAPPRVGLDANPPPAGAHYLAFVVDDEGPGLPAAARRGEPGVTTRAAGSGLGLAIARRVAERHDGALVIEDRPGGGTRIQLILPLPTQQGASP